MTRPNGRALFVPVATGVTCPWCRRLVDVAPDPVEAVSRNVEHNTTGGRCAGSGRLVTESPVDDLLNRAISEAGRPGS